ncbi:hypothetical protein FRC02_002084 [Tulasnella sp. 418]|nr:hypothetical protein FRC02_002084 [Tulasnella sp. 418]
MENPHEQKQVVYLERIIKNADKCLEALRELNLCIEAITAANADVEVASELFHNYRRNVEWNLKTTGSLTSGPILLEGPPEGEASKAASERQ